ncbi:MAG: DUF2085 domain-containing protein [Candidatus Promineifilaceae bacterium]
MTSAQDRFEIVRQERRDWIRPLSRRAIPLIVAILALGILGFHTVTDVGRVNHSTLLGAADYVGSAVCHRITERSFSIAGRQLPLCARCTGMFLGITLTFAVLSLAGRKRWINLPPVKIIVALLVFIGFFAFDGVNSYLHFFPNAPHLYEPHNWLRLLTGMGAGLALGTIVYPALGQTLWKYQIFRPSIGTFLELALLVILALITIALILTGNEILLYIFGLASAAGVVIILSSIGTMMILIITKKDARAERWRDVVLPLAGGLAFALIQIGIISYARIAITGTITGIPGL